MNGDQRMSRRDRFNQLTQREREVFYLVAAGSNNHAIASRLVVSISTVQRHVASIKRKLDLSWGHGAQG